MGKGDIKTRKGKISNGSAGVSRQKKKKTIEISSKPKKAKTVAKTSADSEKTTPVKKAAPKKKAAATKTAAEKKTTTKKATTKKAAEDKEK